MQQDIDESEIQNKNPLLVFNTSISEYVIPALFIALITFLIFMLEPFLEYKVIGLLFMMIPVMFSFFVSFGPMFFLTCLSALIWDFLFIPPIFSFSISDTNDIILLLIYFIISLTMGILTQHFHNRVLFVKKREQKLLRLYEVEKEIANSKDIPSICINLSKQLSSIFPGHFDILVKNEDNQLIIDNTLTSLTKEKEKITAQWVFTNQKMAGWSTDTLPSAEALYLPIVFSKSVMGVLVYSPKTLRPLSLEEIDFLQTICQQLGSFIERQILKDKVFKQDYIKQIEKIHQAIYKSFTTSFYEPLEEIFQNSKKLQETSGDPKIESLFKKIENAQVNLKMIVTNIISISELESGYVHFEKQKHSIQVLVEASLKEMHPFLSSHPIRLHMPPQHTFLFFDFNWLKLALNNLIQNSCLYSPASKPITIDLKVFENEFVLSVLDEGPGIPAEFLPYIFDKFYQIPGTQVKGSGLGLAIVKRVVEIHQGKIEVRSQPGGGTEFSLILPN